ncbi:MAG TPA: hypothetical protein VIY73_07690 [Polyangiaceae bacterium]
MHGPTGRIGAAVVVAWVLTTLFACDGIRQDELDCEEAVAVLDHCCANFPSSLLNCQYIEAGCGTSAVYPDITTPESSCIRAESCSTLVSSGVCDRAARLSGRQGVAPDGGESSQVCP